MDKLFWSRGGRVRCEAHVPAHDGPAWDAEGWKAIPDTASRHGIEFQCDECHAGRPIRHHSRRDRLPPPTMDEGAA